MIVGRLAKILRIVSKLPVVIFRTTTIVLRKIVIEHNMGRFRLREMIGPFF